MAKKKTWKIKKTAQLIFVFLIAIFLIFLQIYAIYFNTFLDNKNTLIKIYDILKITVGSLYSPIYVFLLLYVVFMTYFEEYIILFKNRSKYLIISLFGYIILHNYHYYKIAQINLNDTFLNSVRKIIEVGTKADATGVIGIIPSIISFAFLKNRYVYFSIFILTILSLLFYLKTVIFILLKSIYIWVKYLNSNEYKAKKEKAKAKKIMEQNSIKKNTNKVTENISDYLIKQTDKKFENISKPINIAQTKEEIKKEVKEAKIKEEKKLDNNESISLEETTKDLPNNDLEAIEEIDSIFEEKEMDASEKKEMLSKIKENSETLEEVLNKFKIEAKVENYSIGPTITRYELKIPVGSTKVKNITSLSDDIALALAAESIRIEAPIPGTNSIGIEIPNKIKEPVYFSNLIKSDKLNNLKLPTVVGKNVIGQEVVLDITQTPHLLISGTTGSGKSVFINSIISTLISKKTYQDVKFIMIDPKMVELSVYNDIPHLLTPVITDPIKAAAALKWAVSEMEQRYKIMAEKGFKNILVYNERNPESMPYIVIIIDELADLMMVAANSVEISIARITQKARAVGIHLIVATQRPSTDIITGVIKSNLPSRISFALRSQIDSRTILDQTGAEKLLGHGDMLLLKSNTSKLERIQGAYISDDEIYKIVDVLKHKYQPEYNMDIILEESSSDKDPLYNEIVEYIKDSGFDKVAISHIQQKFKMGFNRASRIFSELREDGILDENNNVL